MDLVGHVIRKRSPGYLELVIGHIQLDMPIGGLEPEELVSVYVQDIGPDQGELHFDTLEFLDRPTLLKTELLRES